MKKMKKLLSLMLAVVMMCSLLSACGGNTDETTKPTTTANQDETTTPKQDETTKPTESTPAETTTEAPKGLTYKDGTVLRMATGYNNKKTGMFFDAEVVGEGITLADGKTYHSGDLKPTWVAVENKLNVKFENKYQGNSATNELKYWLEQMDQVDIVSGNTAGLTEAGVAGDIVNLADYLDVMPNFKAYLEANPIVRLSITGDTKTGAIYLAPYFDGVDDIERMPLMRTDWVEKLLNGEGAFAAEASGTLKAAAYQPYMPTSGKIDIEVAKADGSAVEKISKNYDAAGNIIKTMNDALASGTVTGVQAVNMLRDYIDKAYNGYYGTNRADLFIGQNAAWDADELVALLRCVVANAKTLNGTDTVQGLFSREDDNNQRRVDMFRFVGTLFGVRGLESRMDYLYVGTDGKLHDARQEADTYVALERMNALAKEGLIASSFLNQEDTDTKTMLATDAGFMHYDYNQTQTVYNQTSLQEGEKYMAVMVPVARWYDGTDANGVYMRFTESWRSVKTDAWGISKKGVGNDTDKLNAALAILDYAYSPEGQILMSYGPDAFIKTKADGSYETFNFNGQQMPVIADATYAELWEKASGNYTNYARQYLGSTLAFAKSQAFEYQCTHEVGKEGAGYISTAIGLGLIKHPALAITENPWYSIVPTTLPNTKQETEILNGYAELGSSGKFSTSKGKTNMLVDIIVGGYSGEGTTSRDETVATISGAWGGKAYLALKQQAYDKLIAYYNSLNK